MAKNRPPNPPENVGEDTESVPSSGPVDTASEQFLSGYPGAALLVGEDGSVVADEVKHLEQADSPPMKPPVLEAKGLKTTSAENTGDEIAQPPALTKTQRLTLCTLTAFDASMLVSAREVAGAMEPGDGGLQNSAGDVGRDRIGVA